MLPQTLFRSGISGLLGVRAPHTQEPQFLTKTQSPVLLPAEGPGIASAVRAQLGVKEVPWGLWVSS